MSALQINTRPSDAATESRSYGLADLRAGVLADRGTTVVLRAAVGILAAVAAVILVAGVATQFALGIIGGGIGVAVMTGVLIALAGVPAQPIRR